MPTFAWLARFGQDFRRLSPAQQALVLAAVAELVDDLSNARALRPGLRVKGVQGAAGVFEMTWADNGRATFEYGESVRTSEPHIVWRRIGTHAISKQP